MGTIWTDTLCFECFSFARPKNIGDRMLRRANLFVVNNFEIWIIATIVSIPNKLYKLQEGWPGYFEDDPEMFVGWTHSASVMFVASLHNTRQQLSGQFFGERWNVHVGSCGRKMQGKREVDTSPYQYSGLFSLVSLCCYVIGTFLDNICFSKAQHLVNWEWYICVRLIIIVKVGSKLKFIHVSDRFIFF